MSTTSGVLIPSTNSSIEMMRVTSNDALFSFIERSQISSNKPFGRLLDAGTGSHSLRWISGLLKAENDAKYSPNLHVKSFTAITADKTMQKNVLKTATSLGIADRGDVVLGNWFDKVNPQKSGSDFYDTILADYLIGALDGFSPYHQDLILPRLAHYLKPGGRMYIVGLQPIPDEVEGDADIFCKVTKLRDACILLAGHRCYREYPVDWLKRHVTAAGLDLKQVSKFPIMYSQETILRQLNVARSKLQHFDNKDLAKSMGKQIDQLEKESEQAIKRSPNRRLKLGFDYIVVAEKKIITPDTSQQCDNNIL